MNRHLIVITFLEWLNWNAKGVLRVSPGRLAWCYEDTAATSFLNSMRLAPDLEPADDSFLLADVSMPPRNDGSGNLLVPLEGARFEALSERSSRLLAPSAKRMDIDLALVAADVQDAWADWKETYWLESANQQARRVWSWAWDQPWSFSPDCLEETLLDETRQIETELKSLRNENAARLDPFTGTTAEAWVAMVLAADRRQLLTSEKDASWRGATNAYVLACRRSGRMAASFLPKDDKTFVDALVSLPLDKPEMVQRLAVATGEHHAFRLTSGQDPDLSVLLADIRTLSELSSNDTQAARQRNLSTALLVLGRLMPGAAVMALLQSQDLVPGWVRPLYDAVDPEANVQAGLEQSASGPDFEKTSGELGPKSDDGFFSGAQRPAITLSEYGAAEPEPAMAAQDPMKAAEEPQLVGDNSRSGVSEVQAGSIAPNLEATNVASSPDEAKVASPREALNCPRRTAENSTRHPGGSKKKEIEKSSEPSEPQGPLGDNG